MIQQGKGLSVQVNDCSLAYDDKGSGNIPLVFIHGFPLTRKMWSNQVDQLSLMHRCIAADLRGYGDSTAGSEELSISLFADDTISLLDRLEISKAVLCGLSMGGYIVLNALQRYPDRIQAVILSNTQCNDDNAEAKEKRFENIKVIESGKKDVFVKAMAEKMIASSNASLRKEIITMMAAQDDALICNTLKALANRWETCSSLPEIMVPSLIISGAEDTITPPGKHEYMHEHIKGSQWVSIDQAAHMTPMEQPALFNQAVLNFLSGIS